MTNPTAEPARRCCIKSRCRGYSLIELLVVVFIILLVMTLILCTLAKVWKVVNAWRN